MQFQIDWDTRKQCETYYEITDCRNLTVILYKSRLRILLMNAILRYKNDLIKVIVIQIETHYYKLITTFDYLF